MLRHSLLFALLVWPTLTMPVLGQQTPEEWRLMQSLSAAEAHQSAAADKNHFYAITNNRVAKYDRNTGKRISISTGKAKHLNSGYIWNGKLYCAHSNYPATPEQSQIMVLDPQTMKLTTFKDFGDFDGSLTWAVRHQDHWWCNFAHYGENNAKTFLVKFDNDWTEKDRWTYPRTVISKLGQYSLSGGLWHDGHLLVTGHDDPVVFRLQIPEKGNVLEFIGKASVPFTGQGFAVDPVTGGLIGINRAKRQVVFASRPQDKAVTLRVLSYNIHHGEGVDRKLDLKRIANVILSMKPDIVALQEVDRKVKRTNGVDQPSELAKLTGMKVIFGPNIELQGGDYGNALLSRLPVILHKNHKLPSFENGEQRGVLEVELRVSATESLLILVTHLDHRRDHRERLASAKVINSLIDKRRDQPAILAGDLNDVPDSATLKEIGKQWWRTNKVISPTVPVKKPDRQIDFILYRPVGRWKVVETKVLEEAVASDHRAIFAEFQMLDPCEHFKQDIRFPMK